MDEPCPWRTIPRSRRGPQFNRPTFSEALPGAGLQAPLPIAHRRRRAVMGAERLPARCHHPLIAVALVVRGPWVEHIIETDRIEAPALGRPRLDGGRVTDPAAALGPDLFADTSGARADGIGGE